jgi:uncharacterized protein
MNMKSRNLAALVLILPAPIIGVLCSFYLPEFGKAIWLFAKIWLVLLPVFWLLYVDKGRLSVSSSSTRGVLAGLLWSIPVSAIILGTYWVAGDSLIDENAKAKIDELGITSPWVFLLFATAMSLGNSLMEEYVWRWFVFSKFKVLVGVHLAIACSAFFFTLHHIVIMWNFGSLQLVLVGSLGLFFGAIIWGWLYNKYGSIWPGWICHVAADAAIMWVVWTIITGN